MSLRALQALCLARSELRVDTLDWTIRRLRPALRTALELRHVLLPETGIVSLAASCESVTLLATFTGIEQLVVHEGPIPARFS